MAKFIEARIAALERERDRAYKRIAFLGKRITLEIAARHKLQRELASRENKLAKTLARLGLASMDLPHNLENRLQELESYMQTALRELGEINFQKGNGDDRPRWGTNYKGDALTEWESLENAARYSGIGAAKLKTLGEQGLIDVRKKTDARGYLAHLPSIDAYFKTLPSIAKSTQQQGGDHEKQA